MSLSTEVLTPEALAGIDPDALVDLLPAWLAGTVDATVSAQVRTAVSQVLAQAPAGAIAVAMARFPALGDAYDLHPADPLVRDVSRAYSGCLAAPGSTAHGLEQLRAAVHAGPVLLIGNHLSYVDTQLTDMLLARQDPALADRLVTIAGPKVYETTFRRFASLGLSTLKTAQSSTLSTNDAGLSPREIAEIALGTVRQAHDLLQAGRLVLLYPEGTRSRTGQLGPFLRGADRYTRLDGLQLVPVALTGSDRVFPIDAERLGPARVEVRFGAPIPVAGLARGQALAAAHAALAALLAGGPGDR